MNTTPKKVSTAGYGLWPSPAMNCNQVSPYNDASHTEEQCELMSYLKKTKAS